jgi:photoactive yellow protein
MVPQFKQEDLFEALEQYDAKDFNDFGYGVVRMDRSGGIKAYNSYNSDLASDANKDVIGQNFFTQVAPCTNNFMVAEKYNDFGTELDETLDYILTYRVKPAQVTLRMLAKSSSENQYLLIRLKD